MLPELLMAQWARPCCFIPRAVLSASTPGRFVAGHFSSVPLWWQNSILLSVVLWCISVVSPARCQKSLCESGWGVRLHGQWPHVERRNSLPLVWRGAVVTGGFYLWVARPTKSLVLWSVQSTSKGPAKKGWGEIWWVPKVETDPGFLLSKSAISGSASQLDHLILVPGLQLLLAQRHPGLCLGVRSF